MVPPSLFGSMLCINAVAFYIIYTLIDFYSPLSHLFIFCYQTLKYCYHFLFVLLYIREVIVVEKERKPITVRVSPELKFEIEKAANDDNRTINSWIINAIKWYIENGKK